MNRRRFLAAGGAGALGLGALLYAPFAVGDRFEQFVARTLGVDETLARGLLRAAREEYGDLEYDGHAAAFALAFREPLAGLVPDAAKRRAAEAMLQPMFRTPVDTLAYVGLRRDPARSGCPGLLRAA